MKSVVEVYHSASYHRSAAVLPTPPPTGQSGFPLCPSVSQPVVSENPSKKKKRHRRINDEAQTTLDVKVGLFVDLGDGFKSSVAGEQSTRKVSQMSNLEVVNSKWKGICMQRTF